MTLSRPRTLLASGLVAVAVVALAACSSDSKVSTKPATNGDSSSTSSSTTATTGTVVVKAVEIPQVGKVLVDANGKTVYTLTKDGAAVDCTGQCLAAWPPVLLATGTPAGGPGVNGRLQVKIIPSGNIVTYDDLPLYTFSGDPTAGVANGDGLASFGGTWHVVDLGGAAGSSQSSTTTTTDDGGYNY
jgi:predicted lipoprotein with Yx(FWY)xxD motif